MRGRSTHVGALRQHSFAGLDQARADLSSGEPARLIQVDRCPTPVLGPPTDIGHMRRSGSRLVSVCLCVLGLFLLPVSAHAAQRWVSAQSTVSSGTCSATSPCGIEHAIEGAAAGDEVVVAPGTYHLTGSL